MRLLLATSEPLDVRRGSGTAMAVARLRAALADAGVSVSILAPSRSGRNAVIARARFNQRAAHMRGRYDAVLGVGGDGWRSAREADAPFIALVKALFSRALPWEHRLAKQTLRLQARWEAQGLRNASRVVAPSHFAAAAVVADYGVDAARVRVVAEPFDHDAWHTALPLRPRTGSRVLCVAHLYPRKRVTDLVDAWPLVQRRHPEARLDIVGDGPELRRIARRAQRQPSVFLHGHVDHPGVLEFYARADSFCLPSAQETFGYAAVEAMASGLPVVVAGAGALPDAVEGAVAETVPVADTVALADAVLRSLDAHVRQRATQVNPERVVAFDPRAVAQQMIDVVDELR